MNREATEILRVAKDLLAMYWAEPGRVYRMTRQEMQNGATCPRCRKTMGEEPFTRSERLLTCQKCGFKIPTGKVKKVEIEIEPSGEVEVTISSRRSR